MVESGRLHCAAEAEGRTVYAEELLGQRGVCVPIQAAAPVVRSLLVL
jgi:hypothetical protein